MSAGVDIATLGLEVKSDGVKLASDRLSDLQREGRSAEDSTNKLTAAADKSSAAFGNMAQYVKAAAAAFLSWKATQLAQESTLLAARVETLGVVMHAVGKNVLYTNSQMDDYAKGVAKMGITTEASRASVIKMTQANIQLSNSQELARIAQNAAVIANTNSSEALDRMVTGLATGQAIILHHMGLMVNFEKAYLDTAAALGKTTNELTEEEKSLARVNEVKKAAININGAYEASMSTAGKAMNSLKRFTDELKLSFGELFLPSLTTGVFTLIDGLKFITAHVQELKRGAGDLIAIGLTIFFARTAAAVYDAGRAQAVYYGQLVQGKVVTLGSAQASLQQAAAQVEATQATLAAATATVEETEATLASINAHRSYVVVNGMASVSSDVRAASQKVLMDLNTQLAAQEATLTVATAAEAEAQAAAAAAGIAHGRAMAAATVGAQAMAAAQTAVTGVLGGLKVALSLVGGEIGLIIIALAAATVAWEKYRDRQAAINREIAENSGQSLRSRLMKENAELEAMIKSQSQTPSQKIAENQTRQQEQLNLLKKQELSLASQIQQAAASGDTRQKEVLEAKLRGVRQDIAFAPQLFAINNQLLAQQAKLQEKKSEAPAADPAAARALAERQATYDRQIWDATRAQKIQDLKEETAQQEAEAARQIDIVKQNAALGLISEKAALDQSYDLRRAAAVKKLDLLNAEADAAYAAYAKTSDSEHTDLLQQMQDWQKYGAAVAAARQQVIAIKGIDSNKGGDDALLLQKQAEQLERLNEQVLEAHGSYEQAAVAKSAFEKTSPGYKAATDEIRAQIDALSQLAIANGKLRDESNRVGAQIQLASAMGESVEATKMQIALDQKSRESLGAETKEILKQVDALKLRAAQYAAQHSNDDLKDRVAVAQTDPYYQQEKAAEKSYQRQLAFEKEKYALMNKGTVDAARQLEKLKLMEAEHNEWAKKNEEEKWKSNLGATATAIGQIGQVMMQGNKDQFEAGKAMMMSQAVIAAALAIIQCYAQLGPIGGTIAAIGVGVATAAQIASIADTEYQKKALGGMVYGGRAGKDSVPTMLMPGEVVINADAVKSIGANKLLYANATGKLPQGFADGGMVGAADNYAASAPETIALKQVRATQDNTDAVLRLSDTFHSVKDAMKDQVLSATNGGLTTNRIAGMDVEKDKSTVLGAMMNAIGDFTTAPFREIAAVTNGLKSLATLDFKGVERAFKSYTQAMADYITLGWGGSVWGGKVSVKGQGVELGYQNGQVNAQQYTDLKKDGGWFHSDKRYTEYSALDSALVKSFQDITDGIKGSVNAAGKALGGLSVDLSSVTMSATKLDLRGMSEDQANTAIQKWFEDLANAVSSKLGGPEAQKQLSSVTHFGETSYQALMRVTMALQTVREAGITTGGQMLSNAKNVAIVNGEMADALIKSFGSISDFTDAVDKYNRVVNDDAEYQRIKTAAAHRQIADSLSQYGVVVPQTVEQFKALVKSTDPTSPLYAALLKLSDAFGTIKDSATAAAEAVKAQADLDHSVTSRLFRATGKDTAADLYDLKIQQEKELADARETGLNVTRLLAVQTIEYNKAVKDAQKASYDSMMDAQYAFNESIAAARNEAKDAKKAYDEAVKQQKVTAINAQLDIAQKTADVWKGAADNLKSALGSLKSAAVSVMGLNAQLAFAKSNFDKYYAAVKGGDANAASNLGGAASSYLEAIKSTSTSREDYLTQYSQLYAKLAEAQALAEKKGNTAANQVTLLQKQLDALNKTQDNSVKEAATALAAANLRLKQLQALGLETKDARKDSAMQSAEALKQARLHYAETMKVTKTLVDQSAVARQLAAVAHQDASLLLKAVSGNSGNGTTTAATATGGVDLTPLINELKELRKELASLKTSNSSENNAMATRLLQIERLLEKWDEDGLLTRAA